ncbi:MAG: F0F1 ATP synthase subunit gamma [Gemmatimonadales bacterium]|nr:F0F1 ATP synthase subunit gamma [Gemmatimonadales bacterium]
MQTYERIRRRLETAEDLRSIVRTMKALATVSIRQYEVAAAALEEYAQNVDYGLQILLHTRPGAVGEIAGDEAVHRAGAIVFGSDQGLCGAFNERIAAYFLDQHQARRAEARGPVLAVGARIGARLADGGAQPEATLSLPASAALIGALVEELLARIDGWRTAGSTDGIRVYFNRPYSGAIFRPTVRTVLPFERARLEALAAEPWRPRALPMAAGDWTSLFTSVVRQYLFVTLCRAAAESLASEHASRRAAMHAAERNVDDRLLVLRGEFHLHRQSSITTELLDIVSGYQVLARRDHTS